MEKVIKLKARSLKLKKPQAPRIKIQEQMGKKARLKQSLRLENPPSVQIAADSETEKSVIRKDLLQTVIVNVLFIGLLIGLHYWNQANDLKLDKFISNLIKI